MNILMLSDDYLPNIGGLAAHVYYLSKSLKTLGHDVVVVNPVASQHAKPVFSYEDGLRVLRLPYSQQNNKLARRWSGTQAAYQGIKLAVKAQGPFDLIHQHDHISSTFAAAFYHKLPWVWTNHTSGFLVDCTKPLKRRLVKQAYKNCIGIIAVSPERYEASRQLWPNSKPIEYIPNGVDTDCFKPSIKRSNESFGLPAGRFTVVYPSRITPVKGTLYLAQAIPRLLELRPEAQWHFVLLGDSKADNTDSAYIDEVKRVLEPAYRAGFVSYLGNVAMEKMPEVNALADVVVLPSLMEGMSLSALEAMASGKPVVATDVGGFPEIIHQETTGLLVEPRDPRALADALVRLYDDAKLRERVAVGGYELVTQNFSWRTVAEQTEQFYHSLKILPS